jgi:hypothetical protein
LSGSFILFLFYFISFIFHGIKEDWFPTVHELETLALLNRFRHTVSLTHSVDSWPVVLDKFNCDLRPWPGQPDYQRHARFSLMACLLGRSAVRVLRRSLPQGAFRRQPFLENPRLYSSDGVNKVNLDNCFFSVLQTSYM